MAFISLTRLCKQSNRSPRIFKFPAKIRNPLQKSLMKYTTQNKFSNSFCKCQIHHTRLSWSDCCVNIHAPITGEGIPGKKVKNDQLQRLY